MAQTDDQSTVLRHRVPGVDTKIGPNSGSSRAGGGLSDEETFLALAQNTARVGLWSWDMATDSVWHSDELYRLHGVSRGSLGNRLEDYISFIHPDDRDRVTQGAWAATTGETVPTEYRFVHPEGGVRHLIGHSALVRDRSGTAQRLVGTVQDITEIVRARQSVSESFTRLSAYFEALPTPAYLWRREGENLILRRFNKAASERWGARKAELEGAPASVVCENRPDVVDDINRCLDIQVAITRETDWVSDELGTRRLVITYVPVAHDAVVAHSEDITELLRAYQREEAASARLAEYFQRVPTPAWLWRQKDDGFVLEAANHAGVRTANGHISEFIGMTARELYHDRPDIIDDLRRAISGETFTREMSYKLRTTQELQDLVVTYVHIPPDTVAAHTRDVTEQRRTEAELRESRESARSLMEKNPDGICLIVDGHIRDCNGSLSALLGCSKEALIGRKLHDLMIPEDQERARARGRAILEGGASEPREYTLLRCNGSRLPVEIYGASHEFGGAPALICALRDVSKRNEAERELAESRDALRALTQHLEGVREQERVQVSRDLHDELGSVLTALKIDLADILGAEPNVDHTLLTEMSELLDQAIEVGRRVTARLRPGILDDLGLAAAVEWLASDLEQRTGIECTVVLPAQEPRLAEPVATAMFRILQEAVTNVIRHAEASSVRVELAVAGGRVSLTVIDNGVGFDPSAPVRAGFGLLGMRERVHGLDGALDIVSSPGNGTEIRVELST